MKRKIKNKKNTSYLLVLTMIFSLFIPITNVWATENLSKEENKIIEVDSKTEQSDEVTIQILGTSDLHGKFTSFEYASNKKYDGGLNQISTVVKEAREKNPNTIVMDNGDTIQGNYNHLFLNDDWQNPMILGMNHIEYDVFSLGNHEFNFGMSRLNKILSQANDNLKVLCANLYKDGERVFDSYTIKEFEGIKVAIIGVVSPHIMRWDSVNLAGYESTAPDEEVKKVIEEIKANEGADVFVVSSHVGLESEYGGGDSATDIANTNPEVSAILVGHSHSKIEETRVNNAVISQPQSNGKFVSKFELNVNRNSKEVTSSNASLIQINKDVAEDEELNAKLKSHHDAAYNDANQEIGQLQGGDLAERDEVKGIPESTVEDQGVTDFVNEVQLYYASKQLESKDINPNDVYQVSGAALFSSNSNLKEGKISKADITKIYKYDNKLYTIKTTGKQLKKYMEWTASFYNTYKDGDLTISFNPDIRLYQYDMLDGVKYDINISKDPGNRIENLVFEKDNKAVEDTDVVYLSVNDYRYNSVLAAKVFDKNEHEKIYDTSNDKISDVRDLIIEYIKTVKNGVIERNVDNNWKITGNPWDAKQREIAVKSINDGKVKIPTSEDGRTPNVKSVTWKDVKTALNGIDIITINDFHGSLKPEGKNIGAAKLVGEINRLKENYPNTMVVAGGDLFQGSAMSNLLKGEPVAKMLKELNLEFSAIGNHEFDWGRELIPQWAEQGDFKFLASNIYDKNTGNPVDWAEPYGLKEINGKTIGFIGLATPETAYKTKPDNVADLEFKDPLESTNYWSKFLREELNVDAVIVLSHLGALQDYSTGKITGEAADLAEESTGIDAIISAHTHRFVSGIVNNIPIIQGGYNGRGIAKLEILFNDNNVIIIPSKDELYKKANKLPEDTNMKAIYEQYAQDLDPILNEVVVNVDTDLEHSRNLGVTPLGQFVTKYMAKVSNVQIGITNAGGLRKPLPAGNITVGDMWEVMPFDNTLVTMQLKGSDLKRVLEHGIMNEDIGWVQFHGLKVYYDASKEYGNRITSMRLLDGTKVEMNSKYTVVTNDFMYAKGDNYDFSGATDVLDTGIAIRDALIEELKPLINVSFKFDDKTLVNGKDPGASNNEKPNKVTSLKTIESTADSITVSWNAPTNTEIEEYLVYQDGKLIGTVSNTEITLEGLKSNTLYGIKIVVKGVNGEKSRPVSINARTKKETQKTFSSIKNSNQNTLLNLAS